jgi:hypothetical protein
VTGGNSGAPVELYAERVAINPPSLVAFDPTVVAADQATSVTVTGMNVAPTQILNLENGPDLTFSFQSPTLLTALIPAGIQPGHYTAKISGYGGREFVLPDALEEHPQRHQLYRALRLLRQHGREHTHPILVRQSRALQS